MAYSVTLKFDSDSKSSAQLMTILLDFIGRQEDFNVQELKIKSYIVFNFKKEGYPDVDVKSDPDNY